MAQERSDPISIRRLPIGAEPMDDGVRFRVWAPKRRRVAVVLEDGPDGHGGRHVPRDTGQEGQDERRCALEPESDGYFSAFVPGVHPGSLYRFQLDDDGYLYPDPASRFQPSGPHGPSEVVDPGRFPWTDGQWRGVGIDGQVLYEMHVGTFTPEGTWEAAARHLEALADIGITVLELMPIADFPGRFGWGYDGVDLFAPCRLYGRPDDARRFVDRAHALGLGVILDVVYNHLGPDGNYLGQFASAYVSDRYECEWGDALNFDGPDSGPVRELFLANVRHWIDEYHFDGLRLDATQQIFDRSDDHILAAIVRTVREAAGQRQIFIVAENERQESRLVRGPARGGYGIDALWNDDFHHSAMVALTGRNEAYYSDHLGTPQEFLSAIKWGFLFQGQYYAWQKQPRGTPALDLPPSAFVQFLQNHDQVANSASGLRAHCLTGPGRYRALTAVLLLTPAVPMLFQGQEFGASAPFHYFADHQRELAQQVFAGRKEFLLQFKSTMDPAVSALIPDPAALETFERCRLDHGERDRHPEHLALHRDLLALRRQMPFATSPRAARPDGAVLSSEAFVARFFADDGDDWLLLVNLGRDLRLEHAPEPLLAPPAGRRWTVRWSSEDPRYGGQGTPPVDTGAGLYLPGEAAVVLSSLRLESEL